MIIPAQKSKLAATAAIVYPEQLQLSGIILASSLIFLLISRVILVILLFVFSEALSPLCLYYITTIVS